MSKKPTRCIDPCVKFCQECKYGWIKYPEWVECYEDTFGCTFESGCIYHLEDTVPTEEEEKEFEKRLNELERGGMMSKYEIIDMLEVLCETIRCTPSSCDSCPYGDYEGEKCEVDILIEKIKVGGLDV